MGKGWGCGGGARGGAVRMGARYRVRPRSPPTGLRVQGGRGKA